MKIRAGLNLKEKLFSYSRELELRIWLSDYDGIITIENQKDDKHFCNQLVLNGESNISKNTFIKMMLESGVCVLEIREYLRDKKIKQLGL